MLALPNPDAKAILIAGPTASGKSSLGLELAQQIDGCIINADALQIYKDWQVLTARPSAQDELQCPHHLYGFAGLNTPYSVGHWLRDIKQLLATLYTQGKTPIILGGTGLYFKALTQGLSDIPDISDKTRNISRLNEETHGLEFFGDDLKAKDPDTYAMIDHQNPARTRRAWEVLKETGQGLSYWHANTPPPILQLDDVTPLHMVSETDWLNTRIETRFDQMVELGALEECKQVMNKGWDPTLPSCQAIGAKELISHIQGEIDLDAAITSAKTQTRQYAKRQRTWFRSNMKNWIKVAHTGSKWSLLVD